jgi:hypothetical protein
VLRCYDTLARPHLVSRRRMLQPPPPSRLHLELAETGREGSVSPRRCRLNPRRWTEMIREGGTDRRGARGRRCSSAARRARRRPLVVRLVEEEGRGGGEWRPTTRPATLHHAVLRPCSTSTSAPHKCIFKLFFKLLI